MVSDLHSCSKFVLTRAVRSEMPVSGVVDCGCSYQLVSHPNCSVVFRGLTNNHSYFPMVARCRPRSFWPLPSGISATPLPPVIINEFGAPSTFSGADGVDSDGDDDNGHDDHMIDARESPEAAVADSLQVRQQQHSEVRTPVTTPRLARTVTSVLTNRARNRLDSPSPTSRREADAPTARTSRDNSIPGRQGSNLSPFTSSTNKACRSRSMSSSQSVLEHFRIPSGPPAEPAQERLRCEDDCGRAFQLGGDDDKAMILYLHEQKAAGSEICNTLKCILEQQTPRLVPPTTAQYLDLSIRTLIKDDQNAVKKEAEPTIKDEDDGSDIMEVEAAEFTPSRKRRRQI